jgi:[ribosomal protein S5]-alanine N-acetyltransferase
VTSERLQYRPLCRASLEAFHSLVQDEHVRRYLMDGQILPLEWSERRIRESEALFERRAVGLWLVEEKSTADLIGFCGFLEIPSLHPAPQLVYAMFERHTGRGYATEMARASIAYARRRAGFEKIVAGVDEVNAASLRVLEKLGFQRIEARPGAFGTAYLLRLETGRPAAGRIIDGG